MKTSKPTNTPPRISSVLLQPLRPPLKWAPNHHPASIPAVRTRLRQTPARDGMILTNEIGLELRNPPWPAVTRVIGELDPGYTNSFACLSLPGNTFVQCLHGFNGWHLEWRFTADTPDTYIHLRGCKLADPKKSFELKKNDSVSAGQHRDLLSQQDVIDSFRAFHQAKAPPQWLGWRRFPI